MSFVGIHPIPMDIELLDGSSDFRDAIIAVSCLPSSSSIDSARILAGVLLRGGFTLRLRYISDIRDSGYLGMSARSERPKDPMNRLRDSVRHELAGGSYSRAGRYGIEVILEIRSSTHSYHLVAAYREVAEAT